MATAGVTTLAVVAVAYSPAAFAVTDTTTITGTIGSTITIDSGASVALNVSPSSGAAVSTQSNLVTVTTNNTTGYDLSLSTSAAERDLVHTNTVDKITAHTGTWASPTTIATNSWGYRVDGAGTFGAGPTTVLNSAASSPQTWAGVPASGSAQIIKSSNTNTSGSGENTTVWYAMSADATKPSGNYTNSVVYTAVTKP